MGGIADAEDVAKTTDMECLKASEVDGLWCPGFGTE